MRRTKTVPLKEVIQEYLQALKMNRKLREVGLVNSWEKVVGKTIARATKNIYIIDQKLVVELHSSVVRNELLMIKQPLIERLNQEAGESIIVDIILK